MKRTNDNPSIFYHSYIYLVTNFAASFTPQLIITASNNCVLIHNLKKNSVFSGTARRKPPSPERLKRPAAPRTKRRGENAKRRSASRQRRRTLSGRSRTPLGSKSTADRSIITSHSFS